jgi:hypothetical protein
VKLSSPQENESSPCQRPASLGGDDGKDVPLNSGRDTNPPPPVVGRNDHNSVKAKAENDGIPVLYVEPGNAKEVKTCLERLGFLNKSYRMAKVTAVVDDDAVILPIQQTPEFVGDLLLSHETSRQGKEKDDGNPTTVVGSTRKQGGRIAVPVTESCWSRYAVYQERKSSWPEADDNDTMGGTRDANDEGDAWLDLIVTRGRQEMPLATGQFARHTTAFKKST